MLLAPEKYFRIAAAMDSEVASAASIATGKPAVRKAAAVTGPTAASAAFARQPGKNFRAEFPAKVLHGRRAKKGYNIHARLAHRLHDRRLDRADPARMIRHHFRDLRTHSLERFRQIAPGAFAARQ